MTAKTGDEPLVDQLTGVEPERNRYFTGRYLTADDFATEQAHILDRARLTRRLALGWGIAAGLEVAPHPDRECLDCVLVAPGLAVDAGGRFLILRETRRVGLGDLSRTQALVARYAEQPVLPVPVLTGTGAASLGSLEPSRMREDIELRLVSLGEHGALPAGEVVLAVIGPGAGRGVKPVIDGSDRRPLNPDARAVPILKTNWPHGGRCAPGWVMSAGLYLEFGRPVAGIDAETFEVVQRRPDGTFRRLPPASGFPKRGAGARFVIIRLEQGTQLNSGDTVLVRLRCDFITDAAGQAVSGRFLGGQLPTGPGGPGGVFESWFTLDDSISSSSEGARP